MTRQIPSLKALVKAARRTEKVSAARRGPPPADAERIEAVEPEKEICIREQEAPAAAPPVKTPDG